MLTWAPVRPRWLAAIRLPHRKRHAVGEPLERDPDSHPERHLVGRAAHHVADQPWALVEPHYDQDERQQMAEGGEERLVRDDPRVHLAPPTGGKPLEVAALPVEWLRGPMQRTGQ